jgi:hypothetical protein
MSSHIPVLTLPMRARPWLPAQVEVTLRREMSFGGPRSSYLNPASSTGTTKRASGVSAVSGGGGTRPQSTRSVAG